MKAYKIFNLVIVVFFVTALSIPLIWINKTPGKISTTENRVLANFPKLTGNNGAINRGFIKEFESWFNDNLGFRDALAQTNTKLQFNLFGKLTRTDVLVGKDDWLYYITPDIIKDYQHLNLPNEQELNKWGTSLGRVSNYLKLKKIPFIVMLNPDKKTIYPENYPNSILKVGTTSRTDLITDYFTKKTDLDFFSTYNALIQAKNNAIVYSPRYDIGHWNSYGAFVGYTELMKKIKNYYPDIKVFSIDDFDINSYQREEKIYNAISFSETDKSFDLKSKRQATQTYGLLDNLQLSNGTMAVTYQNRDKSLPKALILGDSYLYGFMTPNLAESFSETTFIYTDNIDRIRSFVNDFKPDIVIYENVERSFVKTMDILSNSTEFEDYNNYKSLPVVNTSPSMWVDYINNEPVQEQQAVVLDKSSELVHISGWALDPQSEDLASDIFLKVGDEYYPGSYGATRTSVSDYFKNPSFTNSGFTFDVDTKELLNVDKISFIIISKDKSYQYSPVEYTVQIK
ncbi:hypothetical protein [Paenibacillus sp. P32E]|uniref:alginate O-acetyltransferase AlgX-related protein n=1 Tax=Paenibacillus sp. P32E TaxID=1349434 RepID=UPI000939C7CC|nr:hypothetical protein [Paenibacillus sp. P32E]OKP85497.1 hypothetical protein A3848_22340 [Paenibacillus sp. P32E]